MSICTKVTAQNLSSKVSTRSFRAAKPTESSAKTGRAKPLCIAGLERFDGTITSDLQPLKNHLGLLFAEPYFFDKITGEEYIRLLCYARHKSIDNIADKNIFDLPLSQYVTTYSTGMKKKLALLAVLLQGNELFVLDEPYNGIDINGSIALTEILLKLKELNKTVIISSHIFSTLSDTCDEILVLRDGIITEGDSGSVSGETPAAPKTGTMPGTGAEKQTTGNAGAGTAPEAMR